MEISIANKDEPLISVVMPVYNSAKFLREAIESILSQTVKDFEFIIVYDESDDGSLEIIKSYCIYERRIKLIYGEKTGLIDALNRGLETAKGKFIARMDADDISLPERFEKQVRLMESERGDVCGCHFVVIGQSGMPLRSKLVPLSINAITVCLGSTVPFAHGSVLIRKSFLNANNLNYSSTLARAEDYGLWVEFFEKGAVFLNVDQFLFKYRQTAFSLSKRFFKETADATKFYRSKFHSRNREVFQRALNDLCKSIIFLGQDDKKYLLMSSYFSMKNCGDFSFFSVVIKSTWLSIGLFLYHLIRGA